MYLETGDAFVYAKDPGTVVIWPKCGKRYAMTVCVREGMMWRVYMAELVTPVLNALGWQLNNWHRPRGNQDVLATAFIWRTD